MYQVIFDDGSEFTGGEPDNSMWDMLPKKPIQSVTYWLDERLKFKFDNFEEYNHCVERVRGVNSGTEVVTKAIIMGRVKNRVYQVIYDLTKPAVYQIVTPWGHEYSNNALHGPQG